MVARVAKSAAFPVRTMSSGPIVIVVNDDDGIEAITDHDVRILSLGKLAHIDYDDACEYINAILESDLDGPTQMNWVKTIAVQFIENNV